MTSHMTSQYACFFGESVGKVIQAPFGGDRRLKLTKRSGCGVAGVGRMHEEAHGEQADKTLECLDDECGESRAIQAFVKGQKAESIGKGMRTDHEVRKNTARSTIVLLSASLCVSLEGAPGQSPHLRGQLPINTDSRFFKERVNERFAATGSRDQLREHGSGGDQYAALRRRFQGILRGQT